jgi:hypothetical protein
MISKNKKQKSPSVMTGLSRPSTSLTAQFRCPLVRSAGPGMTLVFPSDLPIMNDSYD